jgi:hypothetical protein
MLVTIEGMYKDGKIDLAEFPQSIDGAKVIVTFLPQENPNVGRMLTLGQFAGSNMSTEEDFKIAEWHGSKEET